MNTLSNFTSLPFHVFALYCTMISHFQLCDPMDYSSPSSSVHGIFQARTRVGCRFFLQGIFLTQGSNLCLLHQQADSLPLRDQGSPLMKLSIVDKESTCQCRRHRFNLWVKTMRRKWPSTPVFLPGKSHGQRSLVGYSPWGCGELDMTEQLSTQST